MIQSHPIGGPPAKGGGVDNGGKDPSDRHSSRSAASPRPDKGDFRVHRHDAREAATNGGSRDWRRPSKLAHEPYRRDDRIARERWRDRKRWEKPRVREASGDQSRAIIPQQPWHRDGSLDANKDSPSSALIDDFRDPFRGHSYAQKEVIKSIDGTVSSMSRSRLPYDDRGTDNLYDNSSSTSHKPPTANQRSGTSPKNPRHDSRSDGVKPSKKFSKRPGDKFRDLLNGADKQLKTKEPKVADVPELSGSSRVSEPLTASVAGHETRTEQSKDKTGAVNDEHTVLAIVTPDSETSEALTEVPGEVKSDQDGVLEATDSPEAPHVDAVPENVATSMSGATTEDIFEHIDKDKEFSADQNGYLASSSLRDPKENMTLKATTPGESANDDSLMEVCEDKSVSPPVMMVEVTDALASNQSEQPHKLPQEIELQNRLVEEYSKMSEGFSSTTTVLTKQWNLPSPDFRVVSEIRQRQTEKAFEHQTRRDQFLKHQDRWLRQVSDLEKEMETEPDSEIAKATVKPQAVSNHSRKRSRDEDAASSQKAHRRSRDRHNRGHGDVARSEAEFLEILASLEAQTARDPLVRARLTSAKIPDQSQTPEAIKFKSTNGLIIDHSVMLRRLEVDGLDNFTDDEHARFVEAYVQWPKQFGRIGDAVGRSFNDCVMHYYRTKKQENYKQILSQRSKKRRGRKPRKRADEDSIPSTPTAPSTPKLAQEDVSLIPETASANETDLRLPFPSADTQAPENLADTAAAVPSGESKEANTPNSHVSDPIDLKSSRNTLDQMLNSPMQESSMDLLLRATPNSFPVNQNLGPDERRVVPPPVLPLHQMDTLASAALDKSNWDSDKVRLFENLLHAFGLDFDNIAASMGIGSQQVQLYYERNRDKYEQNVDAPRHRTSSTERRLLNQGENHGVIHDAADEGASSTIERLGLPPVVQPQSDSNGTATSVPPPVLPLDAATTSSTRQLEPHMPLNKSSNVAQETLQLHDVAPVGPGVPLPKSQEVMPVLITPFELPPLVTVIPPVLPRDADGGTTRLHHAYGAFPGQTFDGFMESNERQ